MFFAFSGGAVDPSDFSESWLDVFRKCGYKSSELQNEFRYAFHTLFINIHVPLVIGGVALCISSQL